MRWRSIPLLYWERLRSTLAAEILAIVGIAIGVGLLFASQVAATSLDGSATQLAESALGPMRWQLMARGPQGFDAGPMLRRVRELDGVGRATALLDVPAQAIGPHGSASVDLLGVEAGAAKIRSAAVSHLSATQLAHIEAIAVPEAVAAKLGAGGLQQITIQAGGVQHRALIGLEVRARNSALLSISSLIVAPLRYAQKLSGLPGRATRIFVAPKPGMAQQVKRELIAMKATGADVRPASFDATLFDEASAPINQSTELFSAISGLVGMMLAFYALLLTVPQRRGLIFDLRLAGYTPRQVVEVLLFDVLVLGALASALGLLVGEALSRTVFHAHPGYLGYAFPVRAPRLVTSADIGIMVGAAMLSALLGVIGPQTRSIFARFELRREHAEPFDNARALAIGGAAGLSLTTAVLLFAPQLAVLGIAGLTLSALLLLPGALRAVVALLGRVSGSMRGLAPQIALIELREGSKLVRSLAIAATGTIAVLGSVAIGGAQANLQRGLDQSSHAVNAYAAVSVTPAGGYDLFTTAPIDTSTAHIRSRLARLPGVAAVRPYRGSFWDVRRRRLWVLAPSAHAPHPIARSQLIDGSFGRVTARIREGGWIVVSQAFAEEHGLRIGSDFTLPSAHPIRLRVAGIGTNMGWPPGAIILNAHDYQRAWGSAAPSAIGLSVSSKFTPEEVASEARRALAGDGGLTVHTAAESERKDRVASRAGLYQLTEIAILVIVAAVAAMAAAMANVVWQRRPLLAHMQIDGTDSATLWRALLMETTLLLGTGCFLGACLGLYGQLLLSHALAGVTGFPVVISVGGTIALVSFGLVTAAAIVIIAIPGYCAARARPAILFVD